MAEKVISLVLKQYARLDSVVILCSIPQPDTGKTYDNGYTAGFDRISLNGRKALYFFQFLPDTASFSLADRLRNIRISTITAAVASTVSAASCA